MEVGLVLQPVPGLMAGMARQVEKLGFSSLLLTDTQNLAADPFAMLGVAAGATSRITIGTGITNPVTRSPAVVAAAISTVHAESGGRAVCGIGRGDSSVAHIGLKPATTDQLREAILAIKGYVAGQEVDLGGVTSRLAWLREWCGDIYTTPPPIDVAATGRQTIQMAADVADRISLAVGAGDDRLSWALKVIEARLRVNGRRREDISVGAYINLVAHPDKREALERARLGVGLVAHFPSPAATDDPDLAPEVKKVAHSLGQSYDMARHSREDASHLDLIDEDFIDYFAIAGNAGHCINRLRGLREMGLDHVQIIGGAEAGPDPRPARIVQAQRYLSSEVLPVL